MEIENFTECLIVLGYDNCQLLSETCIIDHHYSLLIFPNSVEYTLCSEASVKVSFSFMREEAMREPVLNLRSISYRSVKA